VSPSGREATVYGREKRVLLREYLEQGLSKTEVAEKLGIRRRTVEVVPILRTVQRPI
jgi:hypothetical protein